MGQELIKKVQDEYYNSGGALSLNFEEFCEFFKLEAPVAEHLIVELCATGWFEVKWTVDSSSGEESNRLQIHPKYRHNFWVYSELVPTEAKAILELGALLKNPLNSRIKNLEIEDQHLVKLFLHNQVLHTLPSLIDNFTHLKAIKIQRCKLASLPETIGNLKSLKELDLVSNDLTVLPETIGKLENLQELWCRHNKIITLPETLGSLENLQTLSLDYNQLSTLPQNFTDLKNLQDFSIEFNMMRDLPTTFGRLKHLHKLSLTGNSLSSLPKSFEDLSNLQILRAGRNRFSVFPESLLKLTSLQEIILRDNQLTELPESLINLKKLRTLNVIDNSLSTLPQSVQRLKEQNIVRVHANQGSISEELLKEKRKDGWYEYISTVTGISISEIQELIVKMYSTTGRFSGKQEILDRISQTQSMMFPMYWRNVNKAFFQEMAPKGDWLTQEYINKQTPEDQRELTILNTTIQRITKKSGLTRAKLLRNIGEKDKNYLYWMDWLFRDLNSKKDGKYSDGAGTRQKGSS